VVDGVTDMVDVKLKLDEDDAVILGEVVDEKLVDEVADQAGILAY